MGTLKNNDPLKLYRVRKIKGKKHYEQKEIFHTPFSMRTNVSTCRYSIAGYPCLYLGTSIGGCLKEAEIKGSYDALAAQFQINRNPHRSHINIKVLDLAIKPSDFSAEKIHEFKGLDLAKISVKKSYLQLYPLISACSLIARCKKDHFIPEYIIPQLLMQWLRNQNNEELDNTNSEDYYNLCGIRYFSCKSVSASKNDFNYVFPVCSGNIIQNESKDYCDVLSQAFKFTLPVILSEYPSDKHCEEILNLAECKLLS